MHLKNSLPLTNTAKILVQICMVLFCFGFHFIAAQSINRTAIKLPDTGQNLGYTTTFGEDNDYSINPPKLSLYQKGMVYDSITTLIWQQGDGGEMTWQQAKNYCDTLTLGGFTDWILPNPYEAFTILNHQNPNPAVDTKVFSKTGAEYWYTSVVQVNDSSKVWVINAGGGIGNHPKSESLSAGGTKKFHVRAMRYTTNAISYTQRFIVNGNGTVTDNLTDLMWIQIPNASARAWEDALLLSESNTTGGHSDWRLPNIKELHSLNDEKRFAPSVNTTVFPGLATAKFWSSTTLQNQSSKAWCYDNQYGITTYNDKSNALYVLMVRNTENGASASETLILNQFQIHPNPYRGGSISWPTESRYFEIRNFTGHLVLTGDKIPNMVLDDLQSGNYSITLYNERRASIGTWKLIKVE